MIVRSNPTFFRLKKKQNILQGSVVSSKNKHTVRDIFSLR